jgi:hypothetical protein
VSHARPAPGCQDLAFRSRHALAEEAEVALEDYARAVSRAREAEALREVGDASRVSGVHVCGLEAPAGDRDLSDIEDFALELTRRGGGSGLGWG